MLWDVLWRPALSLARLFREESPWEALRMVTAVRGVSRGHRRLEWALWMDIQSSFLRNVPFSLALRILWCELVQRRFLFDVEQLVGNVARCGVCIAGGFAAWRLERCLQTEEGGDGYPRAVRTGFVSDGYARREVWVPSAVDVFVESRENEDLLLEAIGMRYVFFCSQMFNDPRVATLLEPHEEEEEDDDVDPPVTDADLTHGLDEFGFGQDVRRLCRDQAFLDRWSTTESETAGPAQRRHRMCSFCAARNEPLVPTRLNVVFTAETGPRRTPYVAHVLSSLDLSHRRIVCRVRGDTGAYRFRGAEADVEVLAQRRICIADDTLMRSRVALRETLQRIRRYVERGFSVRGECVFQRDAINSPSLEQVWVWNPPPPTAGCE